MTVRPDADHFGRTRWINWTPTYTNLTVGNGTVVARYVQSGNLVVARYSLTFGSTSAISGGVQIDLPVQPAASYGFNIVGQALLHDVGTERFLGFVMTPNTGLQASIRSWGSAGAVPNEILLSSTVPFTWTTTDILDFQATYEAA